jgi:hypothetical protein
MDLATEAQTESDLGQDLQEVDDVEALAALRELLIDQQRQRVDTMQGDLDRLERLLAMLEDQVNDDDALISTLKPVMADAINRSIRDSRDEMIEALYPITGKLVSKAVSEAMRDLVRNIDNQMRNTFSFGSIKRRIHARASGVSDAEIMLRTALPFHVDDIFLIHRESGLLLYYLASTPVPMPDSDLISGMLTAIRDFVQDVFGQGGDDNELDAIHYSGKQILIEAGRYSYIAAVVEGYEPSGYRTSLRESLNQIEHDYYKLLRNYSGDASKLSGVESSMAPLLIDLEPQETPPVVEMPASDWFQTFNRVVLWVGCVSVALLFVWRLWNMFFL